MPTSEKIGPEALRREWAQLLRDTRFFFENRDVLEVTTDVAVPAGAFEAAIDAFAVPGLGELQTSPEMAMKGVLAEMPRAIFQIAPCFRNDPLSPIHRRQFTMLEFYLVDVPYGRLVETTQAYFEHVLGGPLPWRRRSVSTEFAELGLDLAALGSTAALADAIRSRRIVEIADNDSWNDLFFRVLLEKIETQMDPREFTILEDYPMRVSPLSAPSENSALARRFEIYADGMELCNGCEERRDPSALKARWEQENAERAERKAPPHPYPAVLIDAAQKGLPPCAGTAIGLERLHLIRARRRWPQLERALL